MRGGYIFSGLLHLAVILIAVFGLPALFEPDEIQQPVPVQIVDIAEVTTPPKQEKKPKPAPAKPTPPKPEPPEKKAENTPPPAPPAPPVESEPAPPAPEPVVAPPPEPHPEAEPKKADAEPLPVPEAKPEPPKRPEKKVAKKEPAKPKQPEKKPAEKKKEQPAPREFTSVLKDLEQELRQEVASRPTPDPDPEPTPEAQTQERNLSEEPLTISEIDAIRAQIERCWNVPVGARDAENLIVEIRVRLNPDGSVYATPEILDTRRMASDPFFRAAAESAQRAVLKCSPLKMPAKKYNVWKAVTLRFDPSQMF